MREWNFDELEQAIKNKKPEAEKLILSKKKNERLVRRRSRDEEEQRILDYLCIQKWQEAERDGKVKYISKNEWYYEY